MDLTLLFSLIGIALSILIPLTGYLYKSRKELYNYYSLIWKKSSLLNPRDFMNERPYFDYYFERDVDSFLHKVISQRKNAIIAGPPLSGKTRAVFNALKNSKQNYRILSARSVPMNQFVFPQPYVGADKAIIFIDDLHIFIEKQNTFTQLFSIAKKKNIPVIATCHSGREITKMKNKLIENNLDADILFGDNFFEIGKVSLEEGKGIAEIVGRKWDHVRFNGTIGSIFMKLNEMQRRFEECSTIEKTILRSLRSMYLCGIFEGNTFFKIEWMKMVASRSELTGKDFEWTGWIKSLEEKEFVQFARRNSVWAEDAYLEYIVKPETEISIIELYEDMIEIFNNDAEVLQMAGERAYDTGIVSLEILKYLKLSVRCFDRVLELTDPSVNEQVFFNANKYLGLCYSSLSKLVNIRENCLKSISCFERILGREYVHKHPYELAMVKVKMGNAYTTLAGLENKNTNCGIAIGLLEDALKIYNIDEHQSEHGRTQNSLGSAYLTASNGEMTSEYLLKAIGHFEKSLAARTLQDDPKGYAYTKNNLGGAYARLSQLEDTVTNLNASLDHYNDAMKIYVKEKYPFEYGMTLNNIGNVYCMLSTIRDKRENCMKSKEHFEKSLEVRTKENAPALYSNTMFNLGDVYHILFDTDNDPANLIKAMECLNESYAVDRASLGDVRLGEIYFTLGILHKKLADFQYKHINLNKGLEYLEKALDKFAIEDPARLRDNAIEAMRSIKEELSS